MLTIHLTLINHQVNVHVNGKESHQFSLLELSQSEQEWTDFYKNPRAYGEKLFNALFRDASRAEFDALSKQSERTIVLVLESPELDGVAWEYAFNKAKEEYVVEDCAFVRALPEKERPANGRMKNEVERVPLLFIPANPLVDLSGEPMRALDVEGEWKTLTRYILTSNAPFDLYQLLPATPEDLQTVLANFRDGLIVHFSGHGSAMQDEAMLLFEEKNGRARVYPASNFVRAVKDQTLLVFLSACQSAVAGKTKFSNLARNLVQNGVPYALGMQFDLSDEYDDIISQQFYNYLAHGYTIPQAVLQARRAVKDVAIKEENKEFYIGLIALYAAHPNELGRIVWQGSGTQTHSLFRPADVGDLPSPASGLIGRQRELMRIGTRLLEGKKPLTVTLHGAGGIGKTALLREALLRFAPSFDLTLAIGLDPLPSLESVLGQIEKFLEMKSPSANDTRERETLVRNALTSKRTLLGLDNFETLNYALNEKGNDKEKTAKSLHTFFKSIAANGVTLCVTSREVTNLPGETIEDIQGLTNESGGRLFQENVVKQKDEIYIEKTQQVSEMVGGHPLALRLLASAFDDQVGTSLDQYIKSLQSFLPKARDKWTEEDRHESLRASFDFTMKNLLKTGEGRDLQTALSRLSVFVSFFMESTAAPVLEIHFPENFEEFERIRPKVSSILNSLWERSLLERSVFGFPDEDDKLFFYRLHSILRVFAKEFLPENEINSVKENYLKSMYNLAHVVERDSSKNILTSSVALNSIPDLIIAAESDQDDESSLAQFRVGKILQQFGLYDDALRLLKKSIHAGNSVSSNPKNKSIVLNELGYIYMMRGNLTTAMEMYQQSLKLKEGLKDLKGMSDTQVDMGEILRIRGDLDGAINLYQQALQVKEKLGDEDGKSTILNRIAGILVDHSDLNGAMELYEQSLEINTKLHNLHGVATTLHAIANIYGSCGDFNEAIELYQQVLEIVDGLGDLEGKAATLHEMANINQENGNLNDAIKLYQQALDVFERLDNKKGISYVLANMANVLSENGDLDNALELYQRSLKIDEELGHSKGIGTTLVQVARILVARGDFSSAIDLCQRSLKIFEKLDDSKGKGSALLMIGQLFAVGKEYALSITTLLQSYRTFLSIDEKSDADIVVKALLTIRQVAGADIFDNTWQEVASESLVDFLNDSPNEQDTTIEQFIAGAIQSAREKRPEAEEFFKSAQKMAADSSVPAELRELGRVLQRIIIGDKNVDLSSLPKEWAELVKRELGG